MNAVAEDKTRMTDNAARANEVRDEPARSSADTAPQAAGDVEATAGRDEPLAALFAADSAEQFRARWDAVQSSFVDDPKQAVQQADELVSEVISSLSATFSNERTQFEAELNERASTENLRVALRRYRSFFQRLLSL
jgi:hypothetical protein